MQLSSPRMLQPHTSHPKSITQISFWVSSGTSTLQNEIETDDVLNSSQINSTDKKQLIEKI